ncbi:SMP-30/gluconolactonase/LRE family protein [Pseudomonas sp. FP597]|uniref:SMP-30/gluconolactonase/LRE family protein n=1 Tax=Pseudomonas sp. FP597 TaxID=2954096 RepID=UPI002733A445|nr:SMP-30/gluconolactonase/LRE family protein [Pseudomonas sp. FP597]WLI04509.1 SMP-30/gluconolactonase/LRE family protein [Pseudomonas sp. FP597]
MLGQNPLKGWQVDRQAIQFVGRDLQRPECIIAQPDGTLWAADARGGVMRIGADGAQTLLAPQQKVTTEVSFEQRYVQSQGTSLPNGLALTAEGDFIICNWGMDRIERLDQRGHLQILHDHLGGHPLGKTNFPLIDTKGRIWFTVTTRVQPWTDSINAGSLDGYIGVIDSKGIRIVAEGFGGTNEIRFDDNEEWLYVVESNARRISRLQVRSDGSLGEREVYGPRELEGFPDGFAFDSYGNLWVTLVMSDKLIAITPEGEVLTLLDDGDAVATARLNKHFSEKSLTPEIMAAARGTLAPWMASITFGGPDLKTVYLGSLQGTRIPSFRSPVAGQALIHWR